jgi:uncharacterized coiled-coil protein SlyX
MDKHREAFEKWAQINIKKEFDPIDINDCYKAWQAAIASQEATINTLNDAITEDKILAEINAKLQTEIDRLKAQLAERDKQNE